MLYEIIIGAEIPIEDKVSSKRINFKNWEAKNKAKRDTYRRIWKTENPEKLKISQRRTQLKKKYGLSLEDYDKLLLLQGGHCALCNKTPDGERYGVLAVDHCHKTNRIRGLLCDIHNRALGAFGDNEEGLLKAITYING